MRTRWFLTTDLDPDGCDATWYGVRTISANFSP
jgi:hypothetical protein